MMSVVLRRTRSALVAFAIGFLSLAPTAGATAGGPELAFPSGFELPASLLPRVKLWVEVFGVRSGHEFVSLAQGRIYGRREQFRRSLLRSRERLAAIRDRLQQEALPNILAYLPHVESGFVDTAKSHAGALGLWQIMPDTGRELGLRVDAGEDQRLAFNESTRAAARYLSDAFDELGSWPLAVTAYNYGIGGMKAAAERVGSGRLEDLIARYGGPAFGNAVKNYYAQFLAAAHVAENVDYYFPELRGDPAFRPAQDEGVRRGAPEWRAVPPTWLGALPRRPAKTIDLLRLSAASWDIGPTAWTHVAPAPQPGLGAASRGAALDRLTRSLGVGGSAAGLAWSLQSGDRLSPQAADRNAWR
jgi:hypothetical protein